uniref:LUC7-like (S. cerevisiae) n=1 Tax=Oreochromis niloticus TaxID=8128 RepID=A0A669C090_ORENI
MSAQAQMRALLDQLMGTARDGSVYLCQPTSICKGVAENLFFFLKKKKNHTNG